MYIVRCCGNNKANPAALHDIFNYLKHGELMRLTLDCDLQAVQLHTDLTQYPQSRFDDRLSWFVIVRQRTQANTYISTRLYDLATMSNHLSEYIHTHIYICICIIIGRVLILRSRCSRKHRNDLSPLFIFICLLELFQLNGGISACEQTSAQFGFVRSAA